MNISDEEQLKVLCNEALCAENDVKNKLEYLDQLDKAIDDLEKYKKGLADRIQSGKEYIELAKKYENTQDASYAKAREATDKLKDEEAELVKRTEAAEACNTKELDEMAKMIQAHIGDLSIKTQIVRKYNSVKRNYVLASLSPKTPTENIKLD